VIFQNSSYDPFNFVSFRIERQYDGVRTNMYYFAWWQSTPQH